MKCFICRQGETKPGSITLTLERGETTVVIKKVPAEVCGNCGEGYISEQDTETVLAKADTAAKSGSEVEIIRWAA